MPLTWAHRQTEATRKAIKLNKITTFHKFRISPIFSASDKVSHPSGVAAKRFFSPFFDWVVAASCGSCDSFSWLPTKSTWSWRKLQTEPPPFSIITLAALALLCRVFTSYEARLNSSRMPANQQRRQKRDCWLIKNETHATEFNFAFCFHTVDGPALSQCQHPSKRQGSKECHRSLGVVSSSVNQSWLCKHTVDAGRCCGEKHKILDKSSK